MICYTLVGHFDPRNFGKHPRSLACSRPIDAKRVARLLAKYPAEVAELVEIRDGYVACLWASPRISRKTRMFAYRLAREERCLAVENIQVMFPPEAARAQGEEAERLTGRVGIAEDLERQAREFMRRRAYRGTGL